MKKSMLWIGCILAMAACEGPSPKELRQAVHQAEAEEEAALPQPDDEELEDEPDWDIVKCCGWPERERIMISAPAIHAAASISSPSTNARPSITRGMSLNEAHQPAPGLSASSA